MNAFLWLLIIAAICAGIGWSLHTMDCPANATAVRGVIGYECVITVPRNS